MSIVTALISNVPLTAKANFVKNGDFRLGIAVSEQAFYAGDTLNATLQLTNSSEKIKFISFKGGCQATFKIVDANGGVVFPRYAEETPCNNVGFQDFLIYPEQTKNYYFTFNSSVLAPGNYKIAGFVDGFGATDSISLQVYIKPDFAAKEWELCEGLTGRTCGTGLTCKFRGGFEFGAGICMY